MKPDPCSAAGGPVGEDGAGGRDHLAPRAVDQIPSAGIDDHGSDHQRGDHPADDPVADLLEQKGGPCSSPGNTRLDVRGRHGREEQRYADPVIEPAFDVQALADPSRDAWLGDHRLAEGGVGRRQDHPDDHGLPEGQLAEDHGGGERSECDRQRQPDPEQPQRNRGSTPQSPEVDARGIGEEHERQRRLGQCSFGRAGARDVDLVEDLGADEEPDRDEHHRGRDRRSRQPFRDRGNGDQRQRHGRQ